MKILNLNVRRRQYTQLCNEKKQAFVALGNMAAPKNMLPGSPSCISAQASEVSFGEAEP